MKRLVGITLTVFILLLLASVAVSANRTVGHDTVWVDGGTGSNDAAYLFADGSGAGCTTTMATYLQWDLTDIALDTLVNYVKVTLTANLSVLTTGAQLGIYALSDSWIETTPNESLPLPPALGTALKTISVANGINSPTALSFEGTGQADPLVTYVHNQIKSAGNGGTGDRIVSFAILFDSGCDTNSSSSVSFEDTENSSDSGIPAPDLLMTSSDSNAVNLRFFHAADSAPNWPLIAGFATLAGLALFGAFALRRRLA